MNKKGTFIFLISIVLLVLVNYGSHLFPVFWDLTEDKRFTLTTATVDLINEQDLPVHAEVLYAGDFPAGYQRLQEGVKEILRKFSVINSEFTYDFIDPMEGDSEEVDKRIEELSQVGLLPFPINYESSTEFVAKQAFPYVIFSQGGKNVVVNVIEGNVLGPYSDQNLNRSYELLEYKFANAIQKINLNARPKIGFLEGHGEYDRSETFMLESELRKYYNTGRINLDTIAFIPEDIPLLFVLSPESRFSDRDLFLIDQYITSGGNIIWGIDKLLVNNDSINNYSGGYVPPPRDLNLESLFFRSGIRINNDLVMDLQCSPLRIATASPSGQPQMTLFDWMYHPLAIPGGNSPVTDKLDRLNMYFASSIDTLDSGKNLSKKVLLHSSPYTRLQQTPVSLSFDILKVTPDPALYNHGPANLGVLVEGKVQSLFQNRLTSELRNTLRESGRSFSSENAISKQIFISDASFLRTRYNARTGEPLRIGYNYDEGKLYDSNLSFVINAVEYLMGNGRLLTSKKKEVKLRLIDQVKASGEKTKWQLINILIPLLILIIFGIIFNYWRRKNYQY